MHIAMVKSSKKEGIVSSKFTVEVSRKQWECWRDLNVGVVGLLDVSDGERSKEDTFEWESVGTTLQVSPIGLVKW